MIIDTTKNIWITADSHYGHKNICRGVTDWRTPSGEIPIESTRDFPTIDKMNAAIVNNINSCVGQDDILIHGGDFSFGGFENIEKFRSQIMCKNIYLILGNHDHWIKKNKNDIRLLFSDVDNRAEFYFSKILIVIDHYPLLSWNELKNGSIMLHGHTHLPNDRKFGSGRIMDVGIDSHNEFRAYNLIDEIIPIMLKRPIASEMNYDHHLDRIKNNST